MPKVTEEHRQAQRRRIQDAAMVCIARSGFDGASMAAIIKEAGMSAGAVYRYYESKSELTLAIAERILSDRFTVFTKKDDNGNPLAPHSTLPSLIRSLDDLPMGPPLLLQIWGHAAHNSEFGNLTQRIYGQLLGRFELNVFQWLEFTGEDITEALERARELAPGVLALMQGAIVQVAFMGADSPEAVIRSIEDILKTQGL